MRKLILAFVVFVIAISLLAYFGKQFLLNKFRSGLIEAVEKSTPKGLMIERIGYMPLQGVHLADIAFYKNKTYLEKEFYIPSVYIKFPVMALLIKKTFSPVITIDNLKGEGFILNGSFGFSLKLPVKIEKPGDLLNVINDIEFSSLSFRTAVLDLQKIKGTASITPEVIKTSGITFVLNGEPCKLNLRVVNPLLDLSSELKISSPKINIIANVKKEKEIYEISKFKGNFLNSSIDFIGELSMEEVNAGKEPLLSLYGKADVDIADMMRFAPGRLQGFAESLDLKGVLKSSVYLKSNLKRFSKSEVGLKTSADFIQIRGLKVDKFYTDMRVKDSVISVPMISAYPYGGVFTASAEADLNKELIPFQFEYKLSDMNIAMLIKDTALGEKNIKGTLSSELTVKGNAKDAVSVSGAGKIVIQNANLGPMPLLVPLLGHLYGYAQQVVPDLKKVNITSGTCDFYIKDRKILTENLVLWGDIINIHARGYMDFDRNLNFEVKNEFVKPKKVKEVDLWQANFQKMLVDFGKLVSKAYLTGTLEKPKWRFEYLSGVQNALKGGFDQFLKGIFEQ